jgi:hypothetical protein
MIPRLFGQVGAVKPGVRASPGFGSFIQVNALRLAEYRTWAGGEIPVGAAAASTNVNGVWSSVEADVGWFIVNALIVPAPVARAVPTLADVTGCGVTTSGSGCGSGTGSDRGSPITKGFDSSTIFSPYKYDMCI